MLPTVIRSLKRLSMTLRLRKLTEFILEKRIGTGPTSHPHIYFISLKTEDGKRGFIVHRWNE